MYKATFSDEHQNITNFYFTFFITFLLFVNLIVSFKLGDILGIWNYHPALSVTVHWPRFNYCSGTKCPVGNLINTHSSLYIGILSGSKKIEPQIMSN